MRLHRAITKAATMSVMLLNIPMSSAFSTSAEATRSWSSSRLRSRSTPFSSLTFMNSLDDVHVPATALFLARNSGRGLATQVEGATPTEGGMTLYLKAGPDGESCGDCPFAHYVRMVLEEKNLPYTIRPSTQETKPAWLMDHYEGKMPALRHRSECYVESDVIAEYLEFFFQDPPLTPSTSAQKKELTAAKELAGTVFPAIAKYLKSKTDGGEEDAEKQQNLREVLSTLEQHFSGEGRTGPFIVGNGDMITLVDCSLAPKLFHMQVGLKNLKGGVIDVDADFPAVASYMKTMFERDSFKESSYPEETVVWGWTTYH